MVMAHCKGDMASEGLSTGNAGQVPHMAGQLVEGMRRAPGMRSACGPC